MAVTGEPDPASDEVDERELREERTDIRGKRMIECGYGTGDGY